MPQIMQEISDHNLSDGLNNSNLIFRLFLGITYGRLAFRLGRMSIALLLQTLTVAGLNCIFTKKYSGEIEDGKMD